MLFILLIIKWYFYFFPIICELEKKFSVKKKVKYKHTYEYDNALQN
jgi:hypothetical protein